MRKVFYHFLTSLKYIRHFKIIQSRQYTRAITGDHVTELTEKTLTGRLLAYLEINKYAENTINTKALDILKQNDVTKLRQCNIQQILCAFSLISNRDHCRKNSQFFKIIDLLDHEFCKRLDQLETTDILNVLHTYMNIIPQRILQQEFYEKAMEKLFSKCAILPKGDLIQFMFYVGLQKKTTRSQYMLKKCMNILNEEFFKKISIQELCIICNSTFKTSTKINNKLFLDIVIGFIHENLHILKDPAIFITLIKTIRHNRCQCEELLSTISCTIFFNKLIGCYSFAALCHILALYSDFLYFDSTLMKLFTEKCMESLENSDYTSKHTYLQEQPRGKDIKRFLWSLSNLNYKNLQVEDIRKIIVPNIIKRIQGGEFEHDYESLIEISLYLWMLNYHEFEILQYVLNEENLKYVRTLTGPVQRRLNLLLTSIYFEDRNLYKKINIHPQINTEYNIAAQLEKRPLLQKVYGALKLIPTKFEINKYALNCQVPNLNIIGITGYKKKIYKAVHIEILDDYTCMKNTEGIPSGLMHLKLRIMDKFDEGIIMINANEVESMSNAELSNFLEDELDLVC